MARKRVFGIHNDDARNIESIIGKTRINVTITSPPYFDLKDYEHPDQIGFGQKYEDYLSDLTDVFKGVYNITKEDGTLWVIIDTFRKNGEVIPLPFDLSYHLRHIGWKLQEIIIWEKDKTVPWAHHGQMRNIFEYILVFSKSKDFVFNIDRIRDFKNLKQWWVKYPERYNPRGKTPVAIWDYNIPTQGSWGGNYIRHFCPLPEELISRILLLTTNENDIVLDPFAGTGAVLSKAESMDRKFIGTELNPEYISKFEAYRKDTHKEKKKAFKKKLKNAYELEEFELTIWNLRALKYGRLVINKLIDKFPNSFISIFVDGNYSKTEKRIKVKFLILSSSLSDRKIAKNEISQFINKPPLSKFGIDSEIDFLSLKEFIEKLEKKILFIYTNKNTHKYKKKFELPDLNKKPFPIILSNIELSLEDLNY